VKQKKILVSLGRQGRRPIRKRTMPCGQAELAGFTGLFGFFLCRLPDEAGKKQSTEGGINYVNPVDLVYVLFLG
jgi:hypothetical protein